MVALARTPAALSELRMLKAIVEEEGVSALRLKELYLRDPKKMAQLLETFPMSTVLKKVRFVPGRPLDRAV